MEAFLRRYFDNYIKRFAILFVIIAQVAVLSGWRVITFEPTDFSQLKMIEGKLLLGITRLGSKGNRSSTDLYLVSHNIKTQLIGLRGHQLNFETRKYLKGKHAKAWVDKDNLLYQLEVNGKKIISYDVNKTAYIKAKREDTISGLSFIFISLFFFYLTQLAEPPIETKRN